MTKESSLEELGAKRKEARKRKDLAYQKYDEARKQLDQFYEVMQEAKKAYKRAERKMSREFFARKKAFEHYNAVWGKYNELRYHNKAQIKELKRGADKEHRTMNKCLKRATRAYESGKKLQALEVNAKGEQHRLRRDELNAKVKALIEEIREAKERAERDAPEVDSSTFEAARQEYEQAKAAYGQTKDEFCRLKEEKERLRAEFHERKEEFTTAKLAFRTGLREAEIDQRKRKRILDQAELCGEEREKVKIVEKDNGTIHVFYGGIGGSDGYGHGHVVLDKHRKIVYKRGVLERHGRHNLRK